MVPTHAKKARMSLNRGDCGRMNQIRGHGGLEALHYVSVVVDQNLTGEVVCEDSLYRASRELNRGSDARFFDHALDQSFGHAHATARNVMPVHG